MVFFAIGFTACTDQNTFIFIENDKCITCNDDGCDTTLVSYCFESPNVVSQGTMLKSTTTQGSGCNEALYVFNYFNSQYVIKEDLASGSTNRKEFTNPYTQCGISDFCIDWLLVGFNEFFLVTTDKEVESNYGDSIVVNVSGDHKPIFPDYITGMGNTNGTVIKNESTPMNSADIYIIQSTLKFNVEDLQEHDVRYTFTCLDEIGVPNPYLMSQGYGFETFNGDNGNFDRPDWKVQNTSQLKFELVINQNVIKLNGILVNDIIDGFFPVWDNVYKTGTNFRLHYKKEIKRNGNWKIDSEKDLNATDMTRWIYGGVERRITFIKGDESGDDTGEGCIAVQSIGQEIISQEEIID